MVCVTVLQNDGTSICETYSVDVFGKNKVKKAFVVPNAINKMMQIRNILGALRGGNIPILFDSGMKSCSQKVKSILFNTHQSSESYDEAAVLFFTSGTSGNPIGVVKTRGHLQHETLTHKAWLCNEKFEQCLVTVPFFHIYGFLFGLTIPIALGLNIVTKEDFLPHEIVNLCMSKPTLCITNPVFIRAMLRLSINMDLSNTLFVSSSGPLEPHEAESFEKKYSTRLTQLYGSSETGGVAIRTGGQSVWKLLDGVRTTIDNGVLCVESPFVSKVVYDEDFQQVVSPFRTTDIVEIFKDGFKIIGRESELVKIGGKRLSIIEIETFLEKMDGIEEVLASVKYRSQRLRGEILSLLVVGDKDMIHSIRVKKALHDYFGGIHIECKIVMIDKIEKTAIGKKMRTLIVT